MQIKVHTKGIRGSQVVKEGEEAGALFGVILEIGGHVFDCVQDVDVHFGDKFATVDATFIAGDVEVVTHTDESWLAVAKRAESANELDTIRRKGEQAISIYVDPAP